MPPQIFTHEWWAATRSSASEDPYIVFDRYEVHLASGLRERTSEHLRWLLEPTALHDGRNIELVTRDLHAATLSLDVDEQHLQGRVNISYEGVVDLAWSLAGSSFDLAKCMPAITLGYHEFWEVDGFLRHDMVFSPHAYASITFCEFDVSVDR